MLQYSQEIANFASLISKRILQRALIVALLLGSVLALLNQSRAIFGSDSMQVLPLLLVYLTPFVVVTISQVMGLRRATDDIHDGDLLVDLNEAFLHTVISHGIPSRALLLALGIGLVNTVIVVSSVVLASGSNFVLPIASIFQAFVLPLIFGLLSQTLTYRRAALMLSR